MTEASRSDSEGKIVVRDAKTLEVKSEIPSFGVSPHELFLVDNGETLAVSNSGKREKDRSNIAFIELKSKKLLEKVELDDPEYSAQHFIVTNKGEIFAAVNRLDQSRNISYALATGKRGTSKPLAMLGMPKVHSSEIATQILSVAYDESSHILATTCPTSGWAHLWNMNKMSLLKSFQIRKASGVVLLPSENAFVIASMASGEVLRKVSLKTMECATLQTDKKIAVTAHLTAISGLT